MSAEADVAECEGWARHLLEAVHMESLHHVDPFDVFSELGFLQSRRAPRGCRGIVGGNPLRVHVDHRGPDVVVQGNGGHELGHIAQWMCDVPYPHSEAGARLTGVMARMPKPAVLREVAALGLHPHLLIGRYPRVLPSEVCARAALAVGGAAFFYENATQTPRVVAAHDARLPLDAMFRAYALYRAVRAHGGVACDSEGLSAAVYVDPGRTGPDTVGVVVLVAPQAA